MMSDVVTVIGAVILLIALVGPRVSAGLRGRRRWLIAAGIVLIAWGGWMGRADLLRGMRDSY